MSRNRDDAFSDALASFAAGITKGSHGLLESMERSYAIYEHMLADAYATRDNIAGQVAMFTERLGVYAATSSDLAELKQIQASNEEQITFMEQARSQLAGTLEQARVDVSRMDAAVLQTGPKAEG